MANGNIYLYFFSVALLAGCSFAEDRAVDCTWTSPSGRTYDLRPLRRNVGDDWRVTGIDAGNGRGTYKFTMNFCAGVTPIGTENGYTCDATDAACSLNPKFGPNGEDVFYSLGKVKSISFAEEIGYGINITYTGGSKKDEPASRDRSVTFVAQCVDAAVGTQFSTPYSTSVTRNVIPTKSNYACPIQPATCDLDRYNQCSAPLEQYGAECAAEPTPVAVRKCLDFFFGGDKIVEYCCPCILFYADKYKLPSLKDIGCTGPSPSPPQPPPSPPSPPPSPPPRDILWVEARPRASCTTVCKVGGEICANDAWPKTEAEFEEINDDHDLGCEVIDSKVAHPYNPSLVVNSSPPGVCQWKAMPDDLDRCANVPNVNTVQRFCPCSRKTANSTTIV